MHIHQRLALAYERTGQRKSAIREYLTLAFNFQRANRDDIARQAVERALCIEPSNPEALNTLQAIESAPRSPEVIEETAPPRSTASRRSTRRWSSGRGRPEAC